MRDVSASDQRKVLVIGNAALIAFPSRGHLWQIIHRCHQKKFLLKFAHDRQRYLH
jgi:hypothetical protein